MRGYSTLWTVIVDCIVLHYMHISWYGTYEFGLVVYTFGQVKSIWTCPNGQVGQKVNVEPCYKVPPTCY